MKRFYCTICRRVKRVRVIPLTLESRESNIPDNRLGVCNHHTPDEIKLAKHKDNYSNMAGVR